MIPHRKWAEEEKELLSSLPSLPHVYVAAGELERGPLAYVPDALLTEMSPYLRLSD